MSAQGTFETKDEIIEYLKCSEFPSCLTINYDLGNNNYKLDIGNQPYWTYEQMIDKEQEEKAELKHRLKEIHEVAADIMADYLKTGEVKSKDVVKVYGLSE